MCNNTGSEWCTSDIYAVLDITQLYTLSLHGSITIEQNIYGSYGSHASPVTPVGQVVHGRGCCRQPIRIHDRSHSPISYPWVFRDQSRHHTNMAALIVSEENCILLDKVQAVSDNMWKEHRNYIAGAKGGKACRYLSALNSQPEFPIFATALATMPALGNGITVSLWGDEEPLSMTLFNFNYSQTRNRDSASIRENEPGGRCTHPHSTREDLLSERTASIQHQTEGDPRQGEGEAEIGIHYTGRRCPERRCVGRVAARFTGRHGRISRHR